MTRIVAQQNTLKSHLKVVYINFSGREKIETRSGLNSLVECQASYLIKKSDNKIERGKHSS